MRFLLKMAFWLTLAFVVLPHTPLAGLAIRTHDRSADDAAMVRDNAPGESREQAEAIDTLLATRKTLGEAGDFCTRNPGICETGRSVLSSLGLQAKDGARIAYEYLNGQLDDEPAASAISSKLDALQAKMPEKPKHAENLSIPVPTSREAAAEKMDTLHTGTVKHGN